MPRYPVIYTRLSAGWTAELPTLGGAFLSAPTLNEVQESVRTAVAEQLDLDPADVVLEELVDAGESQLARLR
jgi:hypothetical protein